MRFGNYRELKGKFVSIKLIYEDGFRDNYSGKVDFSSRNGIAIDHQWIPYEIIDIMNGHGFYYERGDEYFLYLDRIINL